ncbi:MCE family protein [Aeromicrobium sp. Leaf350]|uniref:MCE family protein n=1 Tax=Aeromicrobium sp. Leaf350 TaxID=2876565 RepID=UPI001E291B84|nr:MCE family protein [Aeromicrobium sp. Leaf350]
MTRILIKSVVFTLVTVLATMALAATIRNSSGPGETFTAVYTDATSLNKGDDVRMAGVKVGTVSSIDLDDDANAVVEFTVSGSARVEKGTVAQLKFRNLVGQRYISLEPPSDRGAELEPGYTFGLDETEPALDLTLLFNGFQPLLKVLDPEDVNTLSAEIIAVFQGDGASVDTLLASTGSLTSTLAEKDSVIGELITSLNSVLTTVNSRTDQVDTVIVTLQDLVSGLASDRDTIGSTLDGLSGLSVSVAELLEQGRTPLKNDITALQTLAGNLSDAEGTLNTFFQTLPTKLDALGTVGSYGSWLNFYVCQIDGVIPDPEGYYGDLGVQANAARCGA